MTGANGSSTSILVKEVTAIKTVAAFAPGEPACPPLPGVFEEADGVFHRSFFEHRTDLDAGFEAVPQLQTTGEFHRCLGELLLNVLVYIKAAWCDANLPVVPEL